MGFARVYACTWKDRSTNTQTYLRWVANVLERLHAARRANGVGEACLPKRVKGGAFRGCAVGARCRWEDEQQEGCPHKAHNALNACQCSKMWKAVCMCTIALGRQFFLQDALCEVGCIYAAGCKE